MPPSVGRLEGERFDPLAWKPEYPNTAFDNMRPEDAFWAARIVARFSEETIRAVVGKARYTDPRATDYLTRTLMARREKVLRAWLTGVNPLVDAALDRNGRLSASNVAVAAGVASPPSSYTLSWFTLDGDSGKITPSGEPVRVDVAGAGQARAEPERGRPERRAPPAGSRRSHPLPRSRPEMSVSSVFGSRGITPITPHGRHIRPRSTSAAQPRGGSWPAWSATNQGTLETPNDG